MSIYMSQGTIRIRCDIDAADESGRKATIYFVPEDDYSIKHRNEKYAVFVPQSCDCPKQSCDCKSQPCKPAIIRKYNPDKDNWIEIHVADEINCMAVISDAATHQKKVQIQVKVKETLKEGVRVAEAAGKTAEAARKTAEAARKTAEAAEAAEAVEKAVEAAGKDVEAAGKAVEAVEKAVEAAGKDVEAAGKAVEAAVNKWEWFLTLTSITVPAK